MAAIRFEPALGDNNRAPGGAFPVPVRVQHQPGYAGLTAHLRVEVSYDDGRTWSTPPATGSGDHRVALVRHPGGHGYVSLRAKATSVSGSTVEQTTLRAYRY